MESTQRHRVLQAGPITPAIDQQLQSRYDVVPLWQQPDRAAFLLAHGGTFTAMICALFHTIDTALIHGLPNLKAIVNFGVGYDKLDIGTARELGIQVSNTPKVLDDSVADIAMGLLLDVARGISAADRFVRAGGWTKGQRPLMTKVTGKKLGLLGFGGIGQAVARRAAGFDMPIRYHTRHPVAGFEASHETSLIDLASWCDFMVVAVVGGAQTKHMVDRKVLEAIGPKGFVVNIARGSVIDEAAMVAALKAGTLGGAGLDVFENEPNVPEAMMTMDNVVLLSHISGYTHETRHAMEQLTLDNLAAFFDTGKVLTPL